MALPPAWLAVREVFESYRDMHDDTAVIAQSMVAALESRGLRIVPAYAVDERLLRVTLGLADVATEDGRAEERESELLAREAEMERGDD